ncbi:hypothetical protein [Mongoliitalea daihaiensis]|uniref:hypothetical protein n=1 Tax=Mongoliitalea daihaiensis TaxID=2782006 RepID=UPI001F302A19|nr:hypothetical protein [Mongoliitalea daihaiensis]UJP63241.1 hypothetical protein IPZ59_10270 [Mongoliitalea daihaiensis]
MKKFISTCICLLLFTGAFASDPVEKTFLILFDKAELKANKTSTAYIELSLMNIFKTKAYAGNSDAAILVKVPFGNIDKRQLGDFFIRVNASRITPLEEIALQIIDMDENRAIFNAMYLGLEEKITKSKRGNKPSKDIATP